jgi:hypothetical protein
VLVPRVGTGEVRTVEAEGLNALSAESEEELQEAEGEISACRVTGEDNGFGWHCSVMGSVGRGNEGEVGN